MDTMPLTAADVGAVVGNNRGYDGYGMDGCGSWFWIIIILFAFWGNGLGNRGAEQIDVDTRFLERDIFSTNQNVSNTAATTQNEILASSCQTQRDVLENRYTNQLCCCETQKEILQNRYDNSLQTQTLSSQMAQCCCDLKTAIHAEGEATRAQMQNDKIEELRASLNNATNSYNNLTLANSIVSQLQPKSPIPAYITCSPYESNFYGTYGFNAFNRFNNGCGCGCGCGNTTVI